MNEQVTMWQAQSRTTLDVRSDLERGDEPFVRIMETAVQIAPGESFLLIAPFEPVPLYDVLGQRGFQHETSKVAANEWAVRFTRSPER